MYEVVSISFRPKFLKEVTDVYKYNPAVQIDAIVNVGINFITYNRHVR